MMLTGNIISTAKPIAKGKLYKNYFNLEPRFSVSYLFNEENSIKASYNRNTQNIHILTNATIKFTNRSICIKQQ